MRMQNIDDATFLCFFAFSFFYALQLYVYLFWNAPLCDDEFRFYSLDR